MVIAISLTSHQQHYNFNIMLQRFLCVLTVTTALTLSFCTTSKKAVSNDDAMYSYAEDIGPMIEHYCSPCHFPDDGNLKFLDTHKSIRKNIDDIIYRVSLPIGEDGFMPAGSDVALTDDQIQLLKNWRAEGMN